MGHLSFVNDFAVIVSINASNGFTYTLMGILICDTGNAGSIRDAVGGVVVVSFLLPPQDMKKMDATRIRKRFGLFIDW